jgi:hypothetical protein
VVGTVAVRWAPSATDCGTGGADTWLEVVATGPSVMARTGAVTASRTRVVSATVCATVLVVCTIVVSTVVATDSPVWRTGSGAADVLDRTACVTPLVVAFS